MLTSKFRTLFVFTLVLTFGIAYFAIAQVIDPPEADDLNEDRPNAPWITKWWALDGPVTNTGGFDVSGPIDWLSEGTGGALTQESVSTWEGLQMTKTTTVSLPDNGGDLGWTVITIDPADANNMSTSYGLVDESNIDTYAIIVISSPDDRTTTMSPAHDDYAQIWLNGERWYSNTRWTGGVTEVDYDVEVNLQQGINVLLFRCGESGGGDYFNLHFADSDSDLTILPTADGRFFEAIAPDGTAVEPKGKLPTIWGDLKRR